MYLGWKIDWMSMCLLEDKPSLRLKRENKL